MKSVIKDTNYLLNLMNEEISQRNTFKRFDTVRKGAISLDEQAILSLLKSKVFTVNEQKALKVLFSKTKTKSLTESSIRSLDRNVRIISNSSEMELRLKEGFFGDIWDGLKGLGNKAKEAIAGGWGKLKAIWAEFKELVQEVINSAKNGLDKLCGMLKGGSISADEIMGKLKDKKIIGDPDFVKEMKELYQTGKWWTTSWYASWVTSPTWEKEVLAGNGNIQEEPKVDASAAQKGLDAIPQLESLIHKRNVLLSNNQVVTELLQRNKRRNRLSEGHAVEHLDDAIKNPALKKVIHYAIELIQWVFMPLAKLGQVVAKAAAPKILGLFSDATSKIGGPGAFAFELLGTMLGEFVEIYVKKKYEEVQVDMVASILFPGLGIGVKIVNHIHTVLFLWTCANIVINLFDVVNKSDVAGEIRKGVKESYKPYGKFKIKNGNLIYIAK